MKTNQQKNIEFSCLKDITHLYKFTQINACASIKNSESIKKLV